MIEKQVQDLYKKLRKKLHDIMDSESTYKQFAQIIRSGARTFTQHNVETNKYIDEEWVNAIESALPFIDNIINNPRRYIKDKSSVMPIELARKINSNSVKHLASNTHFISRIENEMVIPSKILSGYNEESIDIYENRFVMTLLERVDDFIDMRYYMLGERAGNEFMSEIALKGKFSQNDENTAYSIEMKVDQGPKYIGADRDTVEIFEKLNRVRAFLRSYKSSQFVKLMSAVNRIKMPVSRTNLILKAPEYNACLKLWEFMDGYQKVGYKVEVVDSNPVPSPEFMSETEGIILFNYLMLKNNMAVFQEAKLVEFQKKREYEPKFIKKFDTKVVDAQDIHDYKTLLAAMQTGRSPKVLERIKQAILSALDVEKFRRDREHLEEKQRQAMISGVLKNALDEEDKRKRDDIKDELTREREAEIFSAIIRSSAAPVHEKYYPDESEIEDALKRTLVSSEEKQREQAENELKEESENSLSIEDIEQLESLAALFERSAEVSNMTDEEEAERERLEQEFALEEQIEYIRQQEKLEEKKNKSKRDSF